MTEDPQAVEQPEIPEETAPDAEVVEAVEDYVPPGRDLVVADPSNEIDVFRVLDRHDEDMILREVQSHLTKELLYDFPQDGKRTIDLSYVGVNECVRWMNATGKVKIAVDRDSLVMETVSEDLGEGPEDCWMATLYARDEVTGFGMFGTFIQPKWASVKAETVSKLKKKKKSVDEERKKAPNPFSRQTALGKAQRNALKLFVPERVRQTLIAQYKGDAERVRTIQAGAGAEELAELPPPLQDEKADKLRAEIRGVHEELRRLDPRLVLPAQFHAYMTRAEHSHERLVEFRGYMEQRLAEAREAAA